MRVRHPGKRPGTRPAGAVLRAEWPTRARRVEKSEIMRALIRLADTKPVINGALGDVLDRRAATDGR